MADQVPGATAQEKKAARREYAPWIALFLAILLTLLVWQHQRHEVAVRQLQLLGEERDDLVDAIRFRLQHYESLMRGAAAFLQVSPGVSQQEWRRYLGQVALAQQAPGVRSIGYAKRVYGEEQAIAVGRSRPGGSPSLVSCSGLCVSVALSAPDESSSVGMAGSDLTADPVLAAAMAQAQDSGKFTLSGAVQSPRPGGHGDGVGFYALLPVYQDGHDVSSAQQRRAALAGFVFAKIGAAGFMQGLRVGEDAGSMAFRVADGGTVLFETSGAGLHNDVAPVRRELSVQGRTWSVEATARPGLLKPADAAFPNAVLVLGLMTSAMLFAVLRSLVGQRSLALRKAAEMTQELKRRETLFRKIFVATPNGVMLFDHAGKMVLVNGEAERIFEAQAGELDGQLIEILVPDAIRDAHVHMRERMHWEDESSVRIMGHDRVVQALTRSGRSFPLELRLTPLLLDGERYALAVFQDVTERLRSQREIMAVQTQLRALIDSAREFAIIASDTEGATTVFSAGAQHMLGYSADEVIGKMTPADWHDDAEAAAYAAELSRRYNTRIEGFEVFVHEARLGKQDAHEWRYRRKDGSYLTVILTVSALRDADDHLLGFLGVAYDVSARKETERALTQAKEAAEAASRSKSEFLANMSHEIRTPLNAVLGMAQLLDTEALVPEHRHQVQMIASAGKSLLGILNDILDFSKIEAGRMELVQAPFTLDDVIAAVADIAEMSAAERDIRLVFDVEPDVPRELEGDALRLQQVLVNLIGNAIKFTDAGAICLRVWRDESAREACRLNFSVRDSGIGMTEAQRERLFAPFTQVDMSDTRRFGGTGLGLAICKRIVAMMGGEIRVESAPGQGSEFSFSCALKCREHARQQTGEPRRLLVLCRYDDQLSAIRHIVASLGWLAVYAQDDAHFGALYAEGGWDAVLVDWRDPLSSSAHLPLFEQSGQQPRVIALARRRQLASTDSRLQAIPDVSVVAHPLTAGRLATACMRGQTTLRVAENALAHVRVLVVEDNPMNQHVAQGILVKAGARVTLAGNGQEALDILSMNPEAFDVVLMDVQMPVMDGCTATRILREELGMRLPVIAATAGVLQSNREECLAAGMQDFVSKPLDAHEVINSICRHLDLASTGPLRRAETALPHTPGDEGLSHQLNMSAALERLGGDAELLRVLVEQFCDDANQDGARLQSLLQAGEWNELMRAFHTLKSTSASIGAESVSVVAKAAEHAALARMAGDADVDLSAHVAQTQTELTRMTIELRSWLGGLPTA